MLCLQLWSLVPTKSSLPYSIHPCITNPSLGSKSFVASVKKKKKKKDHDPRRWAINRLPTTCNSKLSDEEAGRRKRNDDDMMIRTNFLDVYHSVLKPELLDDPNFEWTRDSRIWVQQMMDYNVPKGKLMRGLSVVDSYKALKGGKELSEDEVFDASIVGWCIEWFAAAGLILDDFMDSSETRRDQACWYRVPEVGNIAVNDAVLLNAHIPKILKTHFREKSYYVDLLDLFNEVAFQTYSGQMLDLITTVAGERDLSNHTLHLNHHIARYKTGHYTFYLPVACALLIAGEKLENHVNIKDVLLDMGIYFQVVDDYLDCFGDPDNTGKIGSDIEDFKCSWLVVKAMELGNEEQKKILCEHYGKASHNDVAKVKDVYNDINLQGVFAAWESDTYEQLRCCVKAHPSKAVQAIWERYTKGSFNYKMWL